MLALIPGGGDFPVNALMDDKLIVGKEGHFACQFSVSEREN